jgi:hypothetical protein
MKATELRINNLVKHQITKEIIKITAQDVLNLSDGMDSFILEPIPLTEEWLLKCGSYIYKGWDDMQFVRFEPFYSNIFELEIIKGKYFINNIEVEFLHDLQNSFYYHNNRKKELEIK